MKRLAGRVDVCGLWFTVYVVDEVSVPEIEPNYGMCQVPTQTIYINADNTKEGKKYTLTHEVLHAVWALTGLMDVFKGSTTEGLEENIVRAMTSAVHRAFMTAAKVRL